MNILTTFVTNSDNSQLLVDYFDNYSKTLKKHFKFLFKKCNTSLIMAVPKQNKLPQEQE